MSKIQHEGGAPLSKARKVLEKGGLIHLERLAGILRGLTPEESETLELLLDPQDRTEHDPRLLVIGAIGATPWAVVLPYRDNRIRIISARCARAEEVCWYEGEGV